MDKEKKLLIIILLIATILRVITLGFEPYWLDEAISAQMSVQPFSNAIVSVYSGTHQPLHTVLLWGWTKVFGISEFSTRMPSAIFGILSIYVIYLIGSKLYEKKTGLLAATILSFSPIAIAYSQETRLYSMFMFLALLSYYNYIQLPDNKWNYTIVNILMLYTHAFALLIIASQTIHYLITKKKVKEWVKIQAPSLITFIPGMIILLFQMLYLPGSSAEWRQVPGLIDIGSTLNHLAGNIFLTALFSLIIITFFWKDIRKKMLLYLWFIIPFLAVIAYSFISSPIFQTRYFLFTLPALILVVAKDITNLRFSRIIMIIIVCASLVNIAVDQTTTYKDDWRTAAEYLKDTNETIFIHPYYQQIPFAYYYNKECFYAPDFDSVRECNLPNIISTLPENNSMLTNGMPLSSTKDFILVDVRSELLDEGRLREELGKEKVKDLGNGFEIYN